MIAPALALSAPVARAKRIGVRPEWWLTRVEDATRAFRWARADQILDAGEARRREAWAVVEALRDGRIDDWQIYEDKRWKPDPKRWLPGASPEVSQILWRWDSELRQSSRGTVRLVRDLDEPVERWRERVLAECERRIESRWHDERARAEVERFDRARRCGEDYTGQLRCKTCGARQAGRDGVVRDVLATCQAFLICPRCRLARRDRYRRRITLGIIEACAAVRRARAHTGRDRLSSRFLTVTLPALEGGAEEQARVVRGAWRRFANSWRNSWRKSGRAELCRYVRVVEATSGTEGQGHVHAHAWVLSPFVRHHRLRAMWGRALIAEGVPRSAIPHRAKSELLAELLELGDRETYAWAKRTLSREVPWPVLDVRAAKGPAADVAAELAKYLCKDLAANGEELEPELFAAIFRGLAGGRLATASRGFWIAILCECDTCGDLGTVRLVRTRDHEAPPLATGPPGQAAFAFVG